MAFSTFRGMMAASSGNVPAMTNAINFDGSTYLSRGANLTGISNSSTGIFSCWVKLASAGDSTSMGIIRDSSTAFQVRRNGGNQFTFQVSDLGSNTYSINSTATYTGGSTWYNLLISWNVNFASGSRIFNFYINDVSVNGSVTDTGSAFSVPYSSDTNWGVGAVSGGSQPWQGCLSEVYFAPGQFLDFSVSGNRALFYNGGGPANLGSNGALPTGTAPLIYLHTYSPATAFNTNSGTGGSFTTTGTLTPCSTAPIPPAFDVNAANFNGTNSSAIYGSSLTGISASATGIFSCWINMTVANHYVFAGRNSIGLTVDIVSGGKIEVFLTDATGTNTLDIISTTTYSTSTWLNILASWDTNHSAGTKIANLYINGVSSNTVTDTNPAFNCAYSTPTAWDIGLAGPGSLFFNGCLSELYFAPGQFLDFTISGNRAKFYNAGNPADLGATGSTPTGTAPAVYWKGLYTDGTNQGTGGGPFVLTSLTNCGTTP